MGTQQTESFNPATGDMIGTSVLNNTADVQRSVERAREAQQQWADLPLRQRVAHLRKVRNHIAANSDELADIIAKDNGKTRIDALATEVLPAAMAVDYYCRKARSFLKRRRLMPSSWLMANKRSRVIRVPYGVVGIISPWNYPFGIPLSEVVMALLAGNAVLLKVATQTQQVGRALEHCMAAAGLAPGVFTYVNLPGRKAGDAFLAAGVDKLFFTGSVAVGQHLMAKAAETLTPVVLELGGNDPMLVCPDADPYRAAAGALWAGLQNCGQSCAGVERIYVHRTIYAPFMDALCAGVKRLRTGSGKQGPCDLGAMTTRKTLEEVKRQVRQALDAGARIEAQSTVCSEEGNFLAAMVLTGVDHSMDIMRLETFGPILCVMPVDDMDQAVDLANDSDLGLTASVWTSHAGIGDQLARRLKAGVVTVNDHLISHGLAETPWGGFKKSGIGRTHGAIGMAEMTQPQCVVHDVMPKVRKNFWWYPHGPLVHNGLRGLMDFLYADGIWLRLKGLAKLMRAYPRTFFRR